MFCEGGEVFPLLCTVQYLARFFANCRDFFGFLALSLEEYVLGFDSLGQGIFSLVLCVILPKFVIAHGNARPHSKCINEDVLGLSLFRNVVPSLVLFVEVLLFLFVYAHLAKKL